jgi:hypothetical protein
MSDHTNVPFQLKIVELVESINAVTFQVRATQFERLVLRENDGDNALVSPTVFVSAGTSRRDGKSAKNN